MTKVDYKRAVNKQTSHKQATTKIPPAKNIPRSGVLLLKPACPCDGGCPRCNGTIQKEQNPGVSSNIESGINSLKGKGSPLPDSTRLYFEPVFGMDFSRVRVHSNPEASQTAESINANAFTYGNDIVFAKDRYSPGSSTGQKLLAHELTHVVQQDQAAGGKSGKMALRGSGVRISRDTAPAPPDESISVSYVTVYLGRKSYIDFHTSAGLYRYRLIHKDIKPGEYKAEVIKKEGYGVYFRLPGEAGSGRFSYTIRKGEPNPSTFFQKQTSVIFVITKKSAPALSAPAPAPSKDDSDITYLSQEEIMRRCEAGTLRGVKVFPYRGTRFGGAPIMAHRDGKYIIVRQPLYVKANRDFLNQTRTLPLSTFIGGVRLYPNEIVRVHTYEPRWYHLNITGSTRGDKEEEFCVTGEGMLKLAEMSTKRTWLNIGLTVLDAALFFVPVGKFASMIGKPIVQAVGKSARAMAIATVLGLREAAPTAFAGIASRGVTVMVEQQTVTNVAGRAVSNTVMHATIEFGEKVIVKTATRAAAPAALKTGATAGTEAIARSVTVTMVDAAGNKAIATITASQMRAILERAGKTAVAPETTLGFKEAEIKAFKVFLAKPFSHNDISILGRLWNQAARKGDRSILRLSNSRRLFNLQRNRFWTLVRNNSQARAFFTNAGCRFARGAPYYVLNGKKIVISIDHIIERQTAPHLALTASNLRLTFLRENTVLLRLIHQLDPFQAHPGVGYHK
jgi:hypothetical protein